MNRLKFLLFALIVLALWAFHLTRLSPALSSRAAELAGARASAAAPLIAQALAAERTKALSAVVNAGQNPAILENLIPARTSKPEPLSPEKFNAIRDAALSGFDESVRDTALVAVVTENNGSVAAKGKEAAVTEGPDFGALSKAGSKGATVKAFDAEYLVHSFPVLTLEKGEVKALGLVALGVPMKAPDLAPVAKELELASVALVDGDKVVASSGSPAAEKSAATLKADQTAVIDRGSISALGPVKLPILTNGDAMGGGAPLSVASRKNVTGTSFDVISVASVAPVLEPLAEYQRFALLGFAVLLGLTLVWLIIMGSGRPKEEGKAMVMPERPDIGATMKAPVTTMPSAAIPPASEAANGGPAPLSMPDLPPAPEASPDDFEFPNSSPAPAAVATESASDPTPPPASSNFPFDDDQSERTKAYPSMPPADPFGSVGGMAADAPAPAGDGEGDFNPEATRVAMIPTELLQQAQRGKDEPKMPAAAARNVASQAVTRPVSPVGNPDESHWQDVYKDFVATRERCGEPADGLTYEKFKVKLQKNKDQLVQKYNCRTVKFQVYVKEGKAALKATPVKD